MIFISRNEYYLILYSIYRAAKNDVIFDAIMLIWLYISHPMPGSVLFVVIERYVYKEFQNIGFKLA